jgi:hypothetical protein
MLKDWEYGESELDWEAVRALADSSFGTHYELW